MFDPWSTQPSLTLAVVMALLSLSVAWGLLVAVMWMFALAGRPTRSKPGFCRACGYDLTGNHSGICPECGTPLQRDP